MQKENSKNKERKPSAALKRKSKKTKETKVPAKRAKSQWDTSADENAEYEVITNNKKY